MPKRRYTFIPEIIDRMVHSLPFGSEKMKRDAIRRWEEGEEARDPFEVGVFNACDQVKENIENP